MFISGSLSAILLSPSNGRLNFKKNNNNQMPGGVILSQLLPFAIFGYSRFNARICYLDVFIR
jgi:hypothetical protein